MKQALPAYLRSYEDFSQHLDEELGPPLTTVEAGLRFAKFAQCLSPRLPIASAFPPLELSDKQSHDNGIDLKTEPNDNGERLLAQSKLRIRSKDDLDAIISKFQHYEHLAKQTTDSLPLDYHDGPQDHYLIVTASKIADLVKRYSRSGLASVAFFNRLREAERITTVDGPELLTTVQHLYRQTVSIPDEIHLVSASGWLSRGDVHIGLVMGRDIVRLYHQFGEGLFFENIRDFLGFPTGTRTRDKQASVNAKIRLTISESPQKMLARNNGITFRATKATVKDTVLSIADGSIVNGCQTSMCLVHSEPVPEECWVAVKVVETRQAWEVAHSANYQNAVRLVDLDLARYLRPQLFQKVAADQGFGIDSDRAGALAVLDQFHTNRVTYEEVKSLYLGLFSARPNNLWEDHYADLRSDVLLGLLESEEDASEFFSDLFDVLTATQQAISECERTFDDPEFSTYRRFRDKSKYRVYLAIIALAADLPDELSLTTRSSDTARETERMRAMLTHVRSYLANRREEFVIAYLNAYKILARVAREHDEPTDAAIGQNMYNRVSATSFNSLVQDTRMENRAFKSMIRRGEASTSKLG
jgi:AIPR protein